MKHTALGKTFTDLVLQIFRTNGLLLSEGDKLAATEGITSAHWQVIGAIADEPQSVAKIAKIMGLSRQSVQRVANILVDQRICSFEDNPFHKKAKLLKLTKKGEQIIANMNQIQIQWANSFARNLDSSGLSRALDTLKKLCIALRKDKR